MKLEWRILLKAAAAGALLCAGCATAVKAKPDAAAPPTSVQAGATTVVAVAPPAAACCPKPTLPEFLGLKGIFGGIGKGLDCFRNLLGSRFPGLEAKPPMLAITDPANLGPNAPPAVKAAAEIKAEEDAAPQKIKALRYLATIGCSGCYPGVEEGILAALDDCTEAVRFEAVKALRATAGAPCKVCRATACCSPKVRKKLDKIAFEMDDQGCYKESSSRVRRMARIVLCDCGGPGAEAAPRSSLPAEGPAAEPSGAQPTPAAPPPAGASAAREPSLAEALSVLKSGAQSAAPVVPDPQAIAAEVNGEPIYFHELAPRIELRLVAVPAAATPEQLAAARLTALREELVRTIDRKLICQEARRRLLPGDLAKVAYYRVDDGSAALPPAGAALAAQDEERLAEAWIARNVTVPEACTRSELFAHYRANLQKYQELPRIRLEQATARFERFASPDQAAAALAYLRSTLLRQAAQPPRNVNLNALEVRTLEWKANADQPSGVVAQTLATLPVGEVSPVLRDGEGLHVVRVLERTNPGVKSLDEVAEAVRHDLLEARREQARRSCLQTLRERARIWTVMDPTPAQAPLSSWEPNARGTAADVRDGLGANTARPEDCSCRR